MSTVPPAKTDRGRSALSPLAIPLRGWRDILLRTRSEIADDRVGFTAEGVAFYWLLSSVPLLVSTISCYGLFADPADVRNQLIHLRGMVPADALGLLSAETLKSNTRRCSIRLSAKRCPLASAEPMSPTPSAGCRSRRRGPPNRLRSARFRGGGDCRMHAAGGRRRPSRPPCDEQRPGNQDVNKPGANWHAPCIKPMELWEIKNNERANQPTKRRTR